MSRQKKGQPVIDGPSEEAVAEYLKSYPDFFERHSSLFVDLRLAHETGGPATSLLERQIALLRQRNRETEEQLKDLVSVAKLNSSLVEKIHLEGKSVKGVQINGQDIACRSVLSNSNVLGFEL